MYEVDNLDKVVELENLPQSSVGAPIPMILAGEHDVLLTYYLQDTPEDWDGTTVEMVSSISDGKPVAIVKFIYCYAHMFGPPNDESFKGHPLYEHGLGPYGVYKVENSSWIRKLEKMNSVHPYHKKETFMQDKNHYVFSFHDTTFECVADGFEIEVTSGSVKSMIPRMLDNVR